MHTKMMSIGKRIPLAASIAFHPRRKKELSINEQGTRPPMRQNPLDCQGGQPGDSGPKSYLPHEMTWLKLIYY